MSVTRQINELSVLEALETAVSACAGWKAGSLPNRLNENEIECIRTLFTAATSSNDDTLLYSLLHSHQLVEKLASAVRDVKLSWLQQLQQDPEQQQQHQTDGSCGGSSALYRSIDQLFAALNSVLLEFTQQPAGSFSSQDNSACCRHQLMASDTQYHIACKSMANGCRQHQRQAYHQQLAPVQWQRARAEFAICAVPAVDLQCYAQLFSRAVSHHVMDTMIMMDVKTTKSSLSQTASGDRPTERTCHG
jgi:hypothetical protein